MLITKKIVSNIQEIKARKGKVIAVVSADDTLIKSMADHVMEVPEVDELLAPLLSVIPTQLLSYYIGIELGLDVDKPRNLAKSVTWNNRLKINALFFYHQRSVFNLGQYGGNVFTNDSQKEQLNSAKKEKTNHQWGYPYLEVIPK